MLDVAPCSSSIYSNTPSEDFEGSGCSHQGSDPPLLWQYEQYLSGSEPGDPCTHKAYRSALSLHLRARSGKRCRPSRHQQESSDDRHLHQSPRSRQALAIHDRPQIDDSWLASLRGSTTTDNGYRSPNTSLSEHQRKETDPSWAWGGVLRIKLNLALCVNIPFENLCALKGQKSHHYSLHINYVP